MTRLLSIRNRQQTCRVNARLLKRLGVSVLHQDLHVRSYELAVHLVGAEEMAALNQQYLQHEGSTDVITFDYGFDVFRTELKRASEVQFLSGEIFICLDDAVVQAKQFQTTWQSELARYLIHGLLHLRGYDDLNPIARREMKRQEDRIVRAVSTAFTLPKLGTGSAPSARRAE